MSAVLPSTPTDRKKLKVQEIRNLLEAYGEDTVGTKPVLLDRLEAAITKRGDGVNTTEGGGAVTEGPVMAEGTDGAGEDGATAVDDIPEDGEMEDEEEAKVDPPGEEAKNETGQTSISLAEKKKSRAERFGIPLQESAEEKLKARAERFGLPTTNSKEEEQTKKLARAQRFGLDTQETLEEKKKARAQRFGIPTAESEEQKKKARAERFAAGGSGVTSEVDKEKMKKRMERFGFPLGEAATGKRAAVDDEELEAKKKARAERFAAQC